MLTLLFSCWMLKAAKLWSAFSVCSMATYRLQQHSSLGPSVCDLDPWFYENITYTLSNSSTEKPEPKAFPLPSRAFCSFPGPRI